MKHVSSKRGYITLMTSRKVLLAIKARYERVTGPYSHSSSDNPGEQKDLLEVDQLSVRLYMKYQEGVDIQEAIRHDNLLDKDYINNASQFLAPNSQTFPSQLMLCIIL